MKKVEIELDDKLYDDLDSMFEQLGLSIPSAVNIFLHQSLISKGIPFNIRLNESNSAFSSSMENPIINDLTF